MTTALTTTTSGEPPVNVYDRIADPVSATAQLGEWIASSGMFGCTKIEQGHILALQCLAERKSPFDIKRTYHLINGQISMRSDAMLAGYRQRGGKVVWKQFDAKAAVAIWKYDGNEVEIGFSLDDAKIAGLWPAKAGGGWAKDPAAMLRARCISKAVRMLAPEVVMGVYTPEEVADFTTETKAPQNANVRDWDALAKLEKAFEPVESDINAVLLADGRIKEGQTFRDLPEDSIRKLSQKPDLLLSKIPKPVNVEVVA
jgi:hypothetical protein